MLCQSRLILLSAGFGSFAAKTSTYKYFEGGAAAPSPCQGGAKIALPQKYK
jgi:hypothetical protein